MQLRADEISGKSPVYQLGGMMEHNLEYTMSLLKRIPATLDALLRDMPEVWTLRNEGEDTWSAFNVLGHLIHAERTDWMPRVRIVLQSGETRNFEPFGRREHLRQNQGRSLDQLLDDFALLRQNSLTELRALKLLQEDFQRTARHPVLGIVTLSELLATWAAHDLTHLHQISRVMAHQYREAVGPWRKYLGVLHCAGHSAP